MSYRKAIKFVMIQELAKKNKIQPESCEFGNKHTHFCADVYRPKSKYQGTIVFVHGMSVFGKADARITTLCESLTRIGYLTIVPDYQDIQQLKIHKEQCQQISQSLICLLNNQELCPHAKAAIMAPSFSASLALKSSTHVELQNRISALCLIGGYADIDTTMDYLLMSEDAQDYGRLIVLMNFLHLIIGNDTQVPKAIGLAALAQGSELLKDLEKKDDFVKKMSARDQKVYARILSDHDYRCNIWHKILQETDFQDVKKSMDILPVLHEITSAVILIHGKQDNVIAADQSRLLQTRLDELNKNVYLCLTELISHGDSGNVFTMIGEAWGLLKAFGYFFKHIK